MDKEKGKEFIKKLKEELKWWYSNEINETDCEHPLSLEQLEDLKRLNEIVDKLAKEYKING